MEKIDRTDIIQFFKTTFPDAGVTVKDDEINMKCPYCGDSKTRFNKKRFWYNISKDCFNCFNGGCTFRCKSGGFKRILRLYGNHQDKYTFLPYLLSSIKIKREDKIIELDSSEIFKEFYLDVYPFETLNNSQWDAIYKFKEFRFIPLEYPIYIGKKHQANRFVIPIYSHGDLIFWTGRAMNKKFHPKYLNLEVVASEFPFYNADKFNREKPIVIVESLIDAIISRNSNITSSNGPPSIEQIKILLKKTDVGVILAFDWDKAGYYYTKTILKQAKKLGFSDKIKVFFCPVDIKKDFTDLVYAKIVEPEDIYLYILKNSESSYLMTQIKMKNL